MRLCGTAKRPHCHNNKAAAAQQSSGSRVVISFGYKLRLKTTSKHIQQHQPSAHASGSCITASTQQQRLVACLASASNPAEGDTPDDDAAARVLSPAQQQALAYVALALVHTVLAAATTLAPGWSLQHIFGFPLTTATSLQLINAGAYLWLLATCLVCLKDAVLHDRLASDTYKRLNLGVMYQSVVVVVLMLRHKALLAGHVLGCTTAVFVATALVAGRGYASSVEGKGIVLPTILKSFASNVRDLLQPKGFVSAFYAASAALALAQFLWHYPTNATPLFTTDLGPVALLLKQARGAGMVLAGVVWYTLKDAADRGRLAASTFRQLNLAMAMLAALQLWGLWQMAYLGVPVDEQLWRALIAGGVAVVAVCDWQYFSARKQS